MANLPPRCPASRSIDRSQAAYLASLAEIEAVPEPEVLKVTLDVVSITTTLVGVLPKLRALRGQLEATFRSFDFERFDKLEQYGLALLHAEGQHNLYSPAKENLAQTAQALTPIRDRLYELAQGLTAFGLLEGSTLARCKVATGYRPLVSDVLTLVALYDAHWPALVGKLPFGREELLEAKELALQLQTQVGLKQHARRRRSEAALIRQKAFTLLVRTYQEARLAVLYMRARHDDGEAIAPSFYALRSSKRRPEAEAQPPVAATAQAAPSLLAGAATQALQPPSPATPSRRATVHELKAAARTRARLFGARRAGQLRSLSRHRAGATRPLAIGAPREETKAPGATEYARR